MGGKNAVIVMPDADLDKAATAIHGGAFGSSGQRCTATSRVIAHPDIKSALVDRLVAAAKKIKLGPGLDDSTDMGPSVDDRQWQTVMDYIKVGQGEGAQLLTGGTRPEALRQGYLHRADHLRRRVAGDADLQGRDLRTGAGGRPPPRRSTKPSASRTASSTA